MEVLTWHGKNRSPEELTCREKIRELLQLANVGSMDEINELFKETIGEYMETGWRLSWRRNWATTGTTTETWPRITAGIASTPFPFAASYFAG